MAKVLRTVAIVAGVIALAATGIGAIAGGALAASMATVSSIASAVAMGASLGATALQGKPPARGSQNSITIGRNMQTPYPMGRIYPRAALVHDVGYGPTIDDVANPYRSMPLVLGLGPIQEIEAFQTDFQTVTFSGAAATGYYAGFLWLALQLGACPEPVALAGPHGAIPQWSSSHKLSGLAAIMPTVKFDKKGKRWASGLPRFGAVVKGVYVYDPRQDDTYPGGAGACRPLVESTYAGGSAAANPSCHAVTYALGRWQNSKRVFGIGLPVASIDWPAWVEFANVCDANGWTIGGQVFEPGSRWDNLKRICQAGGGRPQWTGGLLTVVFPRPRTALDTITADDLADGEIIIPAMRGKRTRPNTIIPNYVSEAHRWEAIDAAPVQIAGYVTADGEERTGTTAFECVTDVNQASELAAYEIYDGREMGGIVLPLKPRFNGYRIGDALEIDLPEEGLANQLAVIVARGRDPRTSAVSLVLDTETTAKHAAALGLTGAAPPAPTLIPPQDADAVIAFGLRGRGAYSAIEAYFQGDIVQDQGASWEHYGATPTVGVAPPTLPTTSNAHWRIMANVGPAGAAGLNNATVLLFRRSAGTPALPTTTATYTFATAALAGHDNGWTQSVPTANGQPLWVTAAAASSTGASDTIAPGEWASPVIQAQDGTPGSNGAAGINAATVFLFQRAASTPFLPSTTATYTFATGTLTGFNNGWSQSAPAHNGNPLWMTTASALSTGASDTIGAGEWATAQKAAENGAPGSPGTPGSPGSPGTSALTITCSPSAISVPCTNAGAPKSAVPGFQINVFQGTTNVSASASYGTIVSSGVSGASVNSAGTVSVTGMTADTGYVEVPINYGGASGRARVDYVKVKDPNAAVSFSESVDVLSNSGTYGDSNDVNVSLASGQTLNVSANATYYSTVADYRPQGKLTYQNITDGGGETDVSGSERNGGTAGPTEPANFNTSGSFTNGTGGTKIFTVRFKTRKLSGSGSAGFVEGTFAGNG